MLIELKSIHVEYAHNASVDVGFIYNQSCPVAFAVKEKVERCAVTVQPDKITVYTRDTNAPSKTEYYRPSFELTEQIRNYDRNLPITFGKYTMEQIYP